MTITLPRVFIYLIITNSQHLHLLLKLVPLQCLLKPLCHSEDICSTAWSRLLLALTGLQKARGGSLRESPATEGGGTDTEARSATCGV